MDGRERGLSILDVVLVLLVIAVLVYAASREFPRYRDLATGTRRPAPAASGSPAQAEAERSERAAAAR